MVAPVRLPPQIREGTTLLEFYRQLAQLQPRYVSCVCTAAGGTTQTFSHGLGRLPLGNIVAGVSDPSAAIAQCGMPDATTITVELSAAADVTVLVLVL